MTLSLAGRKLLSGGKLTEVSVRRADNCGYFYQHNHLSELKLVGQAGGQTLLCLQLRYVFSSYLPMTVTVTTLLLFGHVNLNKSLD